MPRMKRSVLDDHEVNGNCPVCREPTHPSKCAAPRCNATGTIAASNAHVCAGQAQWFCAYHHMGGDQLRDGRDLQTLTPEMREFIRAARDVGLEWRGESAEHFADVLKEFLKMREIGAEEYRREAMENLQRKLGIVLPSP